MREREREREREIERETEIVRSRQDITISRVILYSVIIQVVKRFATSIKKSHYHYEKEIFNVY